MSAETMQWLNTRTLIGFTEKRDTAWHYREDLQGDEPNHYTGAIPTEDVRRRLFSWTPTPADIQAEYDTATGERKAVLATNRQAIIRPAGSFGPEDEGDVLGVFRAGYKVHDYDSWLIHQVENLLDDGLSIGSAGLLKGGAVAWVQAELPETVQANGIQARPFITAATSVDGSIATTYQTGVQLVVCDNTLAGALGEKTSRVKFRHSSKSLGKLSQVRDALGIVHQVEESFAAMVDELTAVTVSDREFSRFLQVFIPNPTTASKRAATVRDAKREQLAQLWNADPRVQPFAGTAFGVLQAVNTWDHHVMAGVGADRVGRNMLKMITGAWNTEATNTLAQLDLVLAS